MRKINGLKSNSFNTGDFKEERMRFGYKRGKSKYVVIVYWFEDMNMMSDRYYFETFDEACRMFDSLRVSYNAVGIEIKRVNSQSYIMRWRGEKRYETSKLL